jgi:hypothetical protein
VSEFAVLIFGGIALWGLQAWIRPRFHLSVAENRCVEAVTVAWPSGDRGEATAFRVYVSAFGLTSKMAKCRVLLQKVERDGVTLVDQSSPLNWTDTDSFEPTTVDEGRLADLVVIHEHASALEVQSERGRKGYDKFSENGLYTFHVAAIGEWASEGRARIRIRLVANEALLEPPWIRNKWIRLSWL